MIRREAWLTGSSAAQRIPLERILSTALFTDMVDSTATAARLGDAGWKRLFDRHDDVCRRAIARYAAV